MRIDVGLLDAVTAWLEAVNWSGGGGWGASLLLRHLFLTTFRPGHLITS